MSPAPLHPPAAPDESRETRRTVFIRGLALEALIGAYDHEYDRPQPIIIDLSLDVLVPDRPTIDSLDEIVCYNRMAEGVRAIVAAGHIRLVETLAERIALMALGNPLVRAATVRIEKSAAVDGAAGAGVEIRREKA